MKCPTPFRDPRFVGGIMAVTIFVSVPAIAATIHVPTDYTTIQEAIDASVDGDLIIVAGGRYTGTGNKNLDFGGRSITVRANNDLDLCTIDCESDGRAFVFSSGETTDAVVEGFTIEGASVTGENGGGMLFEASSPTIRWCIFLENEAVADAPLTGFGGAIHLDESDAVIELCRFEGNAVSGVGASTAHGGALSLCNGSSPVIRGCVFEGNTATGGGSEGGVFNGYGGAVSSWTGCGETGEGVSEPVFLDCVFTGNRAISADDIPNSGYAGAIGLSPNVNATVTGCKFFGNTAESTVYFGAGLGGAIASFQNDSVFEGCSFAFNDTRIAGGAMWVQGFLGDDVNPPRPNNAVIRDCSFLYNTGQSGAAIAAFELALPLIEDCTFVGNHAMSDDPDGTQQAIGGGGIGAVLFTTPTIVDCVFMGNVSESGVGGAISNTAGNGGSITGCIFSLNEAITGGAVHNGDLFGFGSTLLIEDSFFDENRAEDIGGAVHSSGSSLTVNGGTFTANIAFAMLPEYLGSGGGIYGTGGDVTIDASVFEGNQVMGTGSGTASGGAIHATGECALAVTDSEFMENIATATIGGDLPASGTGGAIDVNDSATIVMSGSRFVGNEAVAPPDSMNTAFGGALIVSGSPGTELISNLVTDCEFIGNSVTGVGFGSGIGGAVLVGTSTVEFDACIFADNTAALAGGAFWLEATDTLIKRSSFAGNHAQSGGALAMFNPDNTPRVEDTEFIGNTVSSLDPVQQSIGGGAIAAVLGSTPEIVRCTFKANASLDGVGGAVSSPGAASMVVSCIFEDNEAATTGGGFHQSSIFGFASASTLANSLLVCNTADSGGAIFNGGDSVLTVADCTVVQNVADVGGGAATTGDLTSTMINNSIFWENAAPTDPQISNVDPAVTTVTYSIVEDGWTGPGMVIIEADPMFMGEGDCGNGDYRLAGSSPAIDNGDNLAVPADTVDLDGNGDVTEPLPLDLLGLDRFVNVTVDIGAFEFQDDCPGDIDGDGEVGFFDLVAVLSEWGPCPGCAGDIDGNDVVDFTDLLIVLASWGPCP